MHQLLHPYTTTGKTITLTVQTIVSKVMSLFFNTLSRFVMGFPGGSVVKNPPANAGATGDVSLIPGSGRSSGGGNGNPL